MREKIEAGFMVFVADGDVGIGAVRDVRDLTSDIVVNIENAGDFVVPLDAVRDVHSGKVILAMDRLDAPVRDAIAHAREAEDPDYTAPEPVGEPPEDD